MYVGTSARLIFFEIFAGIFMWMASSYAETTSVLVDQVEFKVIYERAYSTSSSVTLSYLIENKSQNNVKRFQADEWIDLKVELTSPSGKRVIAYKDQEGAVIHSVNWKRFFVEDIPPGQLSKGEINMSVHYPLDETGVYECVLVKRVYREDPAIVWAGGFSAPGVPIEMTSPVIKFEIKSIDRDYKSPMAEIAIDPALGSSQKSSQQITDDVNVSGSTGSTIGERSNLMHNRPATERADKVEGRSGLLPWLAVSAVVAGGLGWLLYNSKARRKR